MRPLLYRLSYLARKGAQDRAIGFREQVKFHPTFEAPRRKVPTVLYPAEK
jgi:hypothetical protein